MSNFQYQMNIIYSDTKIKRILFDIEDVFREIDPSCMIQITPIPDEAPLEVPMFLCHNFSYKSYVFNIEISRVNTSIILLNLIEDDKYDEIYLLMIELLNMILEKSKIEILYTGYIRVKIDDFLKTEEIEDSDLKQFSEKMNDMKNMIVEEKDNKFFQLLDKHVFKNYETDNQVNPMLQKRKKLINYVKREVMELNNRLAYYNEDTPPGIITLEEVKKYFQSI